MKVLYDSQAFTGQKFGGISRYFNQLIINRDKYYDYKISGKVSNNIYVPSFSNMKPFFDDNSFKGKLRLMKFINRNSDRKEIVKEDYDVYHPTYYEAVTWPVHKPSVITAHDFNSELLPEFFPDNRITEYKKISFQKASKIICISENTRNDLLKLFPEIPEEKTELVYHGLAWDVIDSVSEENKKKNPYILFTGVRNNYKNFDLMIRAISKLLHQFEIKLICTGNPFTEKELALFESLGIKDYISHYYAKDETEFQMLYQGALLFVFPSLYEGFGFPILEAFSAGCPVALSNTSCFPEIAGDAGAFFDPTDEESINSVVKDLLNSPKKRQLLQEQGYKRVTSFTVPKMIEETAAVYRKVF